MPELSIIVPVYKVEQYLPRCVDSILAQTFTDFELILIDDGSPDGSGTICDKYAAQDSRIIVIHQNNQGASAARNAGIDIAVGKYISFLDSDDTFSTDMFNRLIAVQKEKKVDVVICGYNHCREDGSVITGSHVDEGFYSQEQMIDAIYTIPNPIESVCWNKLFLKSKIANARFQTGIKRAEDTLYLLDCLSLCATGYAIADTLCYITNRAGSASRTNSTEAVQAAIEGIRLVYKKLNSIKHTDKQRALSINFYCNQTIRFARRLKEVSKEMNTRCRVYLLKIKAELLWSIIVCYSHHMLPATIIHRYIFEILKL